MQKPLVSILIPFKNTSEYLAECLESICAQHYENWEVLAVNDNSEDNSRLVVQKFALKDERIKVFDNDGIGIIPALRLAYANSSGEFITRMDSDDIMTINKLQVMVDSLLQKGKHHVAIGQVQYFSHRGISNGYERYEAWLNKLTKRGSNYTEIYKECVIPSPCWMVYKDDLDICGAFDTDRYPEDYDLTFRFYKYGLKCIPCNQLLHHWRDYDMRTSRTSEHYAQNYFLDIKLHYFLELEYDEKRPLVVWGAGSKGKTIAQNLLAQTIDFHWVCDNVKKIGKHIYEKRLLHYSHLKKLDKAQSIITVANESEQEKIRAYLLNLNCSMKRDYFFFC